MQRWMGSSHRVDEVFTQSGRGLHTEWMRSSHRVERVFVDDLSRWLPARGPTASRPPLLALGHMAGAWLAPGLRLLAGPWVPRLDVPRLDGAGVEDGLGGAGTARGGEGAAHLAANATHTRGALTPPLPRRPPTAVVQMLTDRPACFLPAGASAARAIRWHARPLSLRPLLLRPLLLRPLSLLPAVEVVAREPPEG